MSAVWETLMVSRSANIEHQKTHKRLYLCYLEKLVSQISLSAESIPASQTPVSTEQICRPSCVSTEVEDTVQTIWRSTKILTTLVIVSIKKVAESIVQLGVWQKRQMKVTKMIWITRLTIKNILFCFPPNRTSWQQPVRGVNWEH